MFANKISLIFCLFKTEGGRKGGKIKIIFRKMSSCFMIYQEAKIQEKKRKFTAKYVIRSKLVDVLNIQA